jgi:hypothetical protein
MDVEGWLPGLMTNGMRVWVAPYFNATREDSYDLRPNSVSKWLASKAHHLPTLDPLYRHFRQTLPY